jgi:NADPH:quinone reductase-like Zn-dependent oxidoreductase
MLCARRSIHSKERLERYCRWGSFRLPNPGRAKCVSEFELQASILPIGSRAEERAGRAMSAPLIIPRSDGAGEIDAVGAGFPDRTGERVWVWDGQWNRPHGTAAEYIVVPDRPAVHPPQNIGYEAGACLGIPALTAIQAVRLAQIGSETSVLITGGAGSVAHSTSL